MRSRLEAWASDTNRRHAIAAERDVVLAWGPV